MKKSLFLLVAATLSFASCSNNEYTGTMPPVPGEGQGGAIMFTGVSSNSTRAIGSDAAALLKYNFSVLGTKTVGGTEKAVFLHDTYKTEGMADAKLYDVWYTVDAAGSTTTNPNRWEYVGEAGAKEVFDGTTWDLAKTQTIKYWDYSASQYDFVAYANTGGIPSDDITATTSGLVIKKATATELAGLYVADKVVVNPIPNPAVPVKFTFRAAAAKVRLGIYETIPGYKVTSITFRYTDSDDVNQTSTTNAILNGSFVGTTASEVDATVTYNEDTKRAEFAYASANTTFFDFGTFTLTSGEMGTTSTTPTWTDVDYTNVLPNIKNVGAMTLYVDYVLTSEGNSGETITVHGAKAVVPASYMAWNTNHKYTYLFKISDNTNGSTGGDNVNPAGLYPITFDAVVEETENEQGTITTVSQPATITTYANGSVSATGITYTTENGPIYFTISNNGTLADLTAAGTTMSIHVGKPGLTEADLTSNAYTGATHLTPSAEEAATTVGGIAFEAKKYAKISLTAGTWYIKYSDGTNVSYKVIVVE